MMQLRSNQRKKLNCTFLALTLREVLPLKKMGQNFHICLRSGPTVDPPTPYGQPDHKISVFYDFPLTTFAKKLPESQFRQLCPKQQLAKKLPGTKTSKLMSGTTI